MDAFESLIEILLKRRGYWTHTSFKVELTREEKQAIGKPSSPRWELDVVAYKGSTNELLAIECKSFLDSTGVKFRDGAFDPPQRYKLFSDKNLRTVVLRRLARQLVEAGAVAARPSVTLCLAVGKMATMTDREALDKHMKKHRWRLFDEASIRSEIADAADSGYENDVAHVVAKLILRNQQKNDRPQ